MYSTEERRVSQDEPPLSEEQKQIAIKLFPPKIIGIFKELREVFDSRMTKLTIKKPFKTP